MYEKIQRILFLTLIVALCCLVMMFTGLVIYLETSIDRVMTKEQQNDFFAMIQNSEQLPENFTETIRKYHPDRFRLTVWQSIADQLVQGRRMQYCPCRDIYVFPIFVKKWIFAANMIIELEVAERFTPEACYSFSMFHTDFGNRCKSVKEAAKLFYRKDLEELTEIEILELDIIRKAPAFYSPFRNRQNLDLAVKTLVLKRGGEGK